LNRVAEQLVEHVIVDDDYGQDGRRECESVEPGAEAGRS
jgi:hypothetical protein